jgi:hypothetical protein
MGREMSSTSRERNFFIQANYDERRDEALSLNATCVERTLVERKFLPIHATLEE